MTSYLLDTNVISELTRDHYRPPGYIDFDFERIDVGVFNPWEAP